MRERPVSGTKYFAGTLLEQDGRIGRHIAVKFKCAHCKKGIGRAKFSCLKASADKKFQTKSCGCQERACFDRFHRAKAAATETIVARRIFESYVLEGPIKTAKRFRISVYTANSIWQRWCRRLERKPEEHRREVFTLAQSSPEHAMSKFGYTKAEVLRICLRWNKGLEARERKTQVANATRSALIEAAKQLFKRYAPVGSLTGSIYEDVELYIASALEGVSDNNWEWGRFPGEFTTEELSSGTKRSHYQWVFETLSAMHPDHVRTCFPKDGEDFLRACKRTWEGRIQRKRDHFKNRGVLQQTKPGRGRKGSVVTPSKTNYLPKPSVPPRVIAKSFAAYSGVISTA